jgi:hypothetical protein
MLARPDLAELALEGLVRADRYAPVRAMHGALAVADIIDARSERIDQLLFGEGFDVLDVNDGLAWGRARRDGVVGWIDPAALAEGRPLASHRVATAGELPLNSLLISNRPGARPIGAFDDDLASVAERLLGVPHGLGARSSVETDCSGLVQQALMACGRPSPRWSDGQATLGAAVSHEQARRGDVVVWLRTEPGDGSWTGHSAIVLDTDRIIHASGHHGAVVIEGFAEADGRCRADGLAAPVFRRV